MIDSAIQNKEENTLQGLQNNDLSKLAWKFNDLNSAAKIFVGKNNISSVPYIPVSDFAQVGKWQITNQNITESRYKEAQQISEETIINNKKKQTVQQNQEYYQPKSEDPVKKQEISKYTPNTFTNRLIQEEKRFQLIQKTETKELRTQEIIEEKKEGTSPTFDDNAVKRLEELKKQYNLQDKSFETEEYDRYFEYEEPKEQKEKKKNNSNWTTSLTLGILAVGIFSGYNYWQNYQQNNRIVQVQEAPTEDKLEDNLNFEEDSQNLKNNLTSNQNIELESNFYQPNFDSRGLQKKSSTFKTTEPKKLNYSAVSKKLSKQTKNISENINGRFSSDLHEKINQTDPTLLYNTSSTVEITANTYNPQFFPIELSYVKNNQVKDVNLNIEEVTTPTEPIEPALSSPDLEKERKEIPVQQKAMPIARTFASSPIAEEVLASQDLDLQKQEEVQNNYQQLLQPTVAQSQQNSSIPIISQESFPELVIEKEVQNNYQQLLQPTVAQSQQNSSIPVISQESSPKIVIEKDLLKSNIAVEEVQKNYQKLLQPTVAQSQQNSSKHKLKAETNGKQLLLTQINQVENEIGLIGSSIEEKEATVIEDNYQALLGDIETVNNQEYKIQAPSVTAASINNIENPNSNYLLMQSSQGKTEKEKQALLKQINELEKEINLINNSIQSIEAHNKF